MVGAVANVGMHQAKTELSRLVARALDGEDVVITRRGRPTVRLVPVAPHASGVVERAERLAGSLSTCGTLGATVERLRGEWD
jgi:prevent-host-death family protein